MNLVYSVSIPTAQFACISTYDAKTIDQLMTESINPQDLPYNEINLLNREKFICWPSFCIDLINKMALDSTDRLANNIPKNLYTEVTDRETAFNFLNNYIFENYIMEDYYK